MSPELRPIDGFALLGQIRLLLVDKDPAERARLRKALEPRFDIVEASNAEEALARLQERWFEAI